MPNHEASSGLTISASNADDFEIFGRVMIFEVGYDRLGIVIGEDGLVVKREFFQKLFHINIISLLYFLAVVFEGIDRVFAGGFDGRVDAKDDTYDYGSEESNSDNLPANIWGKWRDSRDEEGQGIT